MYHLEGRSGYTSVRQVSSGYIMYSIGTIVIVISMAHLKVALGRS